MCVCFFFFFWSCFKALRSREGMIIFIKKSLFFLEKSFEREREREREGGGKSKNHFVIYCACINIGA